VPAGHELRLVLSTVDGQGWFDPDPTLSSFALQTGQDALLELPTLPDRSGEVFLTSCGMALANDVKDCFKDLDDQGVPDDS